MQTKHQHDGCSNCKIKCCPLRNRCIHKSSGVRKFESGRDTGRYDNRVFRLMDTDMASEMTEYTQQNILEQAAVSVLSQANDIPQQVLSLLQK